MAWTIELLNTARRDLRRIDATISTQILDFLYERVASLDHPRELGEPLSGNLRGHWRYRVGNYRIVCNIEDAKLIVLVIKIGHLSDIYR